MNEKSSFDILLENLTALGYQPESNLLQQVSVFAVTGNRYGSNKHVYCVLSKGLYLFAYDCFKSSAYNSSTFTGIYTTVDLPPQAEYRVIKKDWVHFILKNKQRVGSADINKKITLLSSTWIPHRELGEQTVDLFLKLHDSTRRLHTLLVKNDYLPQIEEFKGKKILGIETDCWLYEKGALAQFIEQGSKLVLDVKQNSY